MSELIVGGIAIVALILVAGYLLARERIDDEQARADVEAGARERGKAGPHEGDTEQVSLPAIEAALERSSPHEGDTAHLSMSKIEAMLERSSPNEGDTEPLSMSRVEAALEHPDPELSEEPPAPERPTDSG